MKRGEVATTYLNAVRILQFAPFSESIAFNRFAGRLQRIAPVPWNDEPGDWSDIDILKNKSTFTLNNHIIVSILKVG